MPNGTSQGGADGFQDDDPDFFDKLPDEVCTHTHTQKQGHIYTHTQALNALDPAAQARQRPCSKDLCIIA